MLIAIHIPIQAGLITRILLRQHRDPAARIAWIVVVLALPVVGIVAYLLPGDTNIDTVGEFRRLGMVILIRAPPFAGNNDSRSSLSRVFLAFVLISPIRV